MSDSLLNNKRIVKNTVFLYARMLLILATNLYITRAVLKSLGVVDYGIYNVVAGFVSMFAFLNNSMSIAIQRFFNYERGKNSNDTLNDVYNSAWMIQIIISIITFCLLESLGIWYVNHVMMIPSGRMFATNCVFQFSILSLIIVILQVPYSAVIMANERMNYYAFVGLIDVLLRLSLVIVLPYISFDKLLFYGTLTLGVSIIDIIFYAVYVRKRFCLLHFDLHVGRKLFKPMMSFSMWNLFDMFAYTMKNQGLNVLLNAFFGPVVNAARGIASQIMSAIQSFSSNIIIAFRPQMVESYALGDINRTTSLMYGMSKMSFGFLFLLSLPIMLETDYVLSIWLGESVPVYTSIFTRLVLADLLVCCLNSPLSQVVQAVGDMKKYQLYRSIVVSSVLPFSWLALRFGTSPIFVFVLSLFISIINQPVSLYLLHKIYPYRYKDYLKRVILPCFLFILLSPLLPILFSYYIGHGFIRFLIVSMASVLSTLLFAALLLLSSNERKIAYAFIKNKIGC